MDSELAKLETEQIGGAEVKAALADFDGVWEALQPREQARVIELLVESITWDGEVESISIAFRFVRRGLRHWQQGRKRHERSDGDEEGAFPKRRAESEDDAGRGEAGRPERSRAASGQADGAGDPIRRVNSRGRCEGAGEARTSQSSEGVADHESAAVGTRHPRGDPVSAASGEWFGACHGARLAAARGGSSGGCGDL